MHRGMVGQCKAEVPPVESMHIAAEKPWLVDSRDVATEYTES